MIDVAKPAAWKLATPRTVLDINYVSLSIACIVDKTREPFSRTQLMKPSAIAVDIGSDPDFPSEYELIPYPTTNHHWPEQHQQLPLHYMSEETARRRVKVAGGPTLGSPLPKKSYDDDGSKDAYLKPRPPSARVTSGRLPQPHLPPPTSVVSFFSFAIFIDNLLILARLHLSKYRTSSPSHLHTSLLLDPVL